MGKVSQARIIGMDVSRDWSDIYCLPAGKRKRLPNKVEGHEHVAQLALELGALICFEATGGQEWRLWSTLDTAGIATRQLPRPDQSIRREPGHTGKDGSDRRGTHRAVHDVSTGCGTRIATGKAAPSQVVNIKAWAADRDMQTAFGADQGAWEAGIGGHV